MITPNLKEIFFKHDFISDTTPELENARNECRATIERISVSHGLTLDEYDELLGVAVDESAAAQYVGFIQGFKWAVSLFTGNTESEVTSE